MWKRESEYGCQIPLFKIQGNFMEHNIDFDCPEKADIIRSENQGVGKRLDLNSFTLDWKEYKKLEW